MIAINAVSAALCLGFTWYLLRTCKEHAVYLGYFAFMTSWALISCFYNDLGIYNIELVRWTESTYATAKLSAFYLGFNLGVLFMARLLRNRPFARIDYAFSLQTLRLGYFKLAAYAATGAAVLYIIYSFAAEGIPVLSGLTRIDFFKQANPLERYLIIYAPLIAFVLGYYRKKRGLLSVNGVILAAFVIFAVMIGNKFSFLLILVTAYFAPVYVKYLADHPEARLFTKRRLIRLLAAVCALLLLAFGSYLYVFKNVSHAYTILVNRVLAFQGQMWWAVDHDVSTNGRYDRDHWRVEIDNILAPEETEAGRVGMKYLMVKTLGPERAYAIFEGGYLYTHTYPAILIAGAPYPAALLIQFFAGAIFLIMLYYFYYSLRYRHAIRAGMILLILMPYISVLFSGNFATFFTLGTVIKIVLLCLLELGVVGATPFGPARPNAD